MTGVRRSRLRDCSLGPLLCFLWATLPAFAQSPTVSVSGTVVDAGTRAPIAGAVVSLDGRQIVADPNGVFVVTLSPGRRTIEVTAPGYFPLVSTLDVGAAGVTGAELALARDDGFASSVDVVAAAPAIAPATQTVAPIQVLRTPGALDNIFRTLQTLPGVTATEEFGSRLAVRGGSPDQNLTVMDGVEIHDPYRLFGLTSAFNPETIQGFELATGGFSAKYGDRLSSLLSIENRDGTRAERFAGSATLSITDANIVTEGALPDARGSWLVSARRTYYDLVAARITDQDFPGFADVQGKVTWDAGAGRKLSAFALRSRQNAAVTIDEDDARGEFQDDTANDLAWARFDWSLGSRAQSHTIAAYSNTESTFGVDASFENTARRSNVPGEDGFGIANVIFERVLDVRDASVRQELSWSLGTHVVDIGAEAHWLDTTLRYQIDGDRNPSRGQRIERARRRGFARSAVGDQPVDSYRRVAAGRVADRVTRGGASRPAPGSSRQHRGSAAVTTRGGILVSRPIAADQGRDRTVYAEPRLREARAKRLPRGSRQRRCKIPGQRNRDARIARHRAGSAGRSHGARRGLLQTFH